ncbi:S8 family peptidase [Methylobacterium sp. W2]|uniref:S8 family peptidase n=1 Tax=Methylobacterium sp. W2 TaxID=2598107 RepID=UPI001D0C7030|nr:S8 family peptidase [Methylobacterium sp. W2]MCC0808820.1 S8 family peptidase [Methylobacterium sp. W2]
MAGPRYLIGGGEQLSVEIARPPRGSGEKTHPYSFAEARELLAPQWQMTGERMRSLPALACPEDQAVVEITLHPTYLAKSYYPNNLVRDLNLRHVGSKAVHIEPHKRATLRAAEDGRAQPAPRIFLAGHRRSIESFSDIVGNWAPADDRVKDEFRQIETVGLPGPDRRKKILGDRSKKEIPLEVVLHADPEDDDYVVRGFQDYVKSLDLEAKIDLRRYAGGLCFLPMHADPDKIDAVVQFSFLRALRSMARITPLDPLVRGLVPGFRVELPAEDATARDVAVAIFDGGLPDGHGLDRWVTMREPPGIGAPIPAAQKHGLAVTSAFLFGPLEVGKTQERPHANVDHWRVLGADTAGDDFELFSILGRIEDAVTATSYEFINISLGPDCAMDDDDVNVWTSTLDTVLSHGKTVATVACGNNGEADQALGMHRIQPPSDGVNMIAVGACDSPGAGWKRAPYSAVGPGRSPGYVKPDFVAFGGSHSAPFLVLHSTGALPGSGVQGTSFAAPLAMRAGAGIRAHFSEPLFAPTIKALLVHHADLETHEKHHVGWGRLSHLLGDIVVCNDGEARIIYQRQMPTSGSVRLYLPVPSDIRGDVEIKATFSLFCDVDPEDSINYTRAGLDIQFRPNTFKIAPPYVNKGKLITPTVPISDNFFGANDFYAPEYIRRDDAQKWETTVSRTKRKRASSLNQPAFDVSHIARMHGHSGSRSANLTFALVLTIKNRHMTDLFDRVVASSGGRLKPLRTRTGVMIPARSR